MTNCCCSLHCCARAILWSSHVNVNVGGSIEKIPTIIAITFPTVFMGDHQSWERSRNHSLPSPSTFGGRGFFKLRSWEGGKRTTGGSKGWRREKDISASYSSPWSWNRASIVGRKLVHIDFFHVKAPKFLDDSPPRMYLQLLVCAFANETNYCRRFRALSDMESPNFEARQSLSAAIYEPLTSATRGWESISKAW